MASKAGKGKVTGAGQHPYAVKGNSNQKAPKSNFPYTKNVNK